MKKNLDLIIIGVIAAFFVAFSLFLAQATILGFVECDINTGMCPVKHDLASQITDSVGIFSLLFIIPIVIGFLAATAVPDLLLLQAAVFLNTSFLLWFAWVLFIKVFVTRFILPAFNYCADRIDQAIESNYPQ